MINYRNCSCKILKQYYIKINRRNYDKEKDYWILFTFCCDNSFHNGDKEYRLQNKLRKYLKLRPGIELDKQDIKARKTFLYKCLDEKF